MKGIFCLSMPKPSGGGFVSIHRQIFKDPLYFEEPFTKSAAWIDLILLANHQTAGFFFRRIWVEVKRGQVGFSVKSLAQRWLWSRGRTIRFIKWLENDHRVVQQKTNVTTVISILNYDKWQKNGHRMSTGTVPQAVHQTDINNNVLITTNKAKSHLAIANAPPLETLTPEPHSISSGKLPTLDDIRRKFNKP